ncbi:hypothetical protein N7449_002796 [Penicillium cf. viridicatum]|uniref:Uncharacterized protein n=1 Tax=Penicillium cf. viridicatum TaxID=2972119 RepID=A0A9W9MW07_9EURO|nr:hypothetical protein N7449_002796 [Penicillium cf. viridicatum]
MPLNSSEFNHLDAATSLSRALQSEKIHYLFLGGYATGLIGGNRVTEVHISPNIPSRPHDLTNIQDVDVLTEKDCRELLLKRPGFTRSGDGKLVYDYRRTKVYVDVMGPLMAHLRPPNNGSLQRESRGSSRAPAEHIKLLLSEYWDSTDLI